MASFQNRVIGAIKADQATFAEVRQDPAALTQAALVVIAAGVAGAIGALSWAFVGGIGLVGLVMAPVFEVVIWVIGSAVLWIIGTKVITGSRTEVDLRTVLRTLGFAMAAMIFKAIGIIPFVGWMLSVLVSLWAFYAMLVAVKEVFGYPDVIKAFLALLLCSIVLWVVMVVVTFTGLMIPMSFAWR
jgi:hypothetical protein